MGSCQNCMEICMANALTQNVFSGHFEYPLKSLNKIKKYKLIPFPIFVENCSIRNERNIHQAEGECRKIRVKSRENEALPTRLIKKKSKMRNPMLFFIVIIWNHVDFGVSSVRVPHHLPPIEKMGRGYNTTYPYKKFRVKIGIFPEPQEMFRWLGGQPDPRTCVLFSCEF